MTATMRAIDLTTQIIAPIVTGQVMDWSVENGAIFLSAWNLVSCVVEYFLLWKVYNTVPALRKRKDFKRSEREWLRLTGALLVLCTPPDMFDTLRWVN